jgi:hypothetical protein
VYLSVRPVFPYIHALPCYIADALFHLVNWATGLPGVQPRWEGEYSVFVGDLGRDVGEGELVVRVCEIFPEQKRS